MVEKKGFEDPLGDIDPVMQQAFSVENKNLDFTNPVSEIQFPMLNSDESGSSVEVDVFSNIPVRVSVELGRSQISLKEVFELTEGSIIELERLVGEPLDLVVNGQVIAHGEVVAIDNNYGFRVTSIISSVKR
jgi:flagellar motor switch protein FliN